MYKRKPIVIRESRIDILPLKVIHTAAQYQLSLLLLDLMYELVTSFLKLDSLLNFRLRQMECLNPFSFTSRRLRMMGVI